MNKPTALSIGMQRGKLEIKQFMRQRESVVFTMLFPLILLAIFGSVFSNTIADGVTFSQYFVAGMIASGLVNTGFQQLAIMIPMERDFGTLKRLRGTPMPASSYFLGKAILVTVSMLVQVALLLAAGVAFFGVNLPQSADKWLLLAALLILGSACWVLHSPMFLNLAAELPLSSPPLSLFCNSSVASFLSLPICRSGCSKLPQSFHSNG